MTPGPQSCGPQNAAQDIPNLGLVRPPLVYLISLVVGALIQLAAPLPFLPRTLSTARSVSRRGRHRAVLVLRCEIPSCRHARTRPKANHRDRPDGPVSLQPEPDISGFLTVTARYRDLGQQPVALGHTRWRCGAHPLRRHTKRRAVPGAKIRCPVLGLQGLRAPLAVSHPTRGWSGPAHEGRVTKPHIVVRRPLSRALGSSTTDRPDARAEGVTETRKDCGQLAVLCLGAYSKGG